MRLFKCQASAQRFLTTPVGVQFTVTPSDI